MKRKTTPTTPYDTADYLQSEEDCAAFLQIALEEANGDAAHVARAMGVIARARGMREIAEKTGAGVESLYKSFDGVRVPSLSTFLKTLRALGLELTVRPAHVG